MPLTSTDVRELAELESRAAAVIREKRPHYFMGDDPAAYHAAQTCDLRSAAFLAIAEDMDRNGFSITAEKS